LPIRLPNMCFEVTSEKISFHCSGSTICQTIKIVTDAAMINPNGTITWDNCTARRRMESNLLNRQSYSRNNQQMLDSNKNCNFQLEIVHFVTHLTENSTILD
jgi:hypothetical protein